MRTRSLQFLSDLSHFSLQPFLFNQSPSHLCPLTASAVADVVKAILCESKHCCVSSINHSWGRLAQVRIPALAWFTDRKGIKGTSRLIQTCDIRGREGDGILVYLISRLTRSRSWPPPNCFEWLKQKTDYKCCCVFVCKMSSIQPHLHVLGIITHVS